MITKQALSCRQPISTRRTTASLSLLCLIALLVGCSGGPAPVKLPSFDPVGAGKRAMELYDTDGDGFVAGEELENAPGLNAALKNLDANKDSKVSAEEIAERIRTWQTSRIGLMSFSCDVLLDGKPLESGTVTYDPEEFLGGAIQQAVGELATGSAVPLIPKEKRPTPDTPPGIQAGIYKVRISRIVNGKETIPARYNTETTLGHEVSRDDPAIANKRVIFKLKSK